MEILGIVAPVFGLILLGWALRAIGFLREAEVGALVKVVYYLGLPMVLFVAITGAELSEVVDAVSLAGILLAISSFSVAFFLVLRLLSVPVAARAALVVVVMRGNMAFVGLPIVLSAWGTLGLAKAGVIIGVLTGPFAIATVVLFRLARDTGGLSPGVLLRSFLDPIVIAALGGLSASAVGLSLPGALQEGMEMLAGMALPAALLAIGSSFSRQSLAGRKSLTAVAGLAKLVLLPTWGLLLLWALGLSSASLDLKVAVFLLTTPSAVANYVMSRELIPAEAPLVGTTVALTTVLAAVTMTVWLVLLGA
ncbi:MAG TPA: AEC family transporter [Thermoleophilia bacterium]|nr:AEC family transporter [Thermoleophilia bacterium]